MTGESEAIKIARIDENISFIREQLERGIDKFHEIDTRLDALDKTATKHEQLMVQHPLICEDIKSIVAWKNQMMGRVWAVPFIISPIIAIIVTVLSAWILKRL